MSSNFIQFKHLGSPTSSKSKKPNKHCMKALQSEQTLRNLQTALAAGEAKLERAPDCVNLYQTRP